MTQQRTIEETSGDLFFHFKVNGPDGSPDYELIEAAKRYWLKDTENKWVFSPGEIAARMRVPVDSVPGLAAKLIHTCLNEGETICDQCGTSEPLITRDDYANVKAFFDKTGYHVCQVCMNHDPEGFLNSTRQKINDHPLFKKISALVKDKNKVTQVTTPNFNYERIGVYDALHLHAILVCNKASWNGRTFKVREDSLELIHPYPNTVWALVERLAEKGIIIPLMPEVDLDLVIDVGFKGDVGFDIFKWALATNDPRIVEITDVLSILDSVFSTAIARDTAGVRELFIQVAVCETLNFLNGEAAGILDEEELDCDMIFATLEYAISTYSIAEVRTIIKHVTQTIKEKLNIKDVAPEKLVKMLADTIRSSVDGTLDEELDIEPTDRLPGEKASLITSMLFNRILKCGNAGFTDWSARELDNYLESKNGR